MASVKKKAPYIVIKKSIMKTWCTHIVPKRITVTGNYYETERSHSEETT
jgi:hypothetical protein